MLIFLRLPNGFVIIIISKIVINHNRNRRTNIKSRNLYSQQESKQTNKKTTNRWHFIVSMHDTCSMN